MQAGEVKELRVIVKADVQGSVEAVSDALNRLSTKEVKLTMSALLGGRYFGIRRAAGFSLEGDYYWL